MLIHHIAKIIFMKVVNEDGITSSNDTERRNLQKQLLLSQSHNSWRSTRKLAKKGSQLR